MNTKMADLLAARYRLAMRRFERGVKGRSQDELFALYTTALMNYCQYMGRVH